MNNDDNEWKVQCLTRNIHGITFRFSWNLLVLWCNNKQTVPPLQGFSTHHIFHINTERTHAGVWWPAELSEIHGKKETLVKESGGFRGLRWQIMMLPAPQTACSPRRVPRDPLRYETQPALK